MAKITNSRLYRLYDMNKYGELFRRAVPFKPQDSVKQMCQVCTRPMIVSPGSIAKYHGSCRPFKRNKQAIISRQKRNRNS